MEKEIYENLDICGKCGGKCCKKSGCDYYPEDIKTSAYKEILEILECGNISIVSLLVINEYKGKMLVEPFLYLRARNIDRDVIDLFSFKKQCSMLGDDGCKYSFEERPTGAKMLIPKENGMCSRDSEEINKFKEKWAPYQKTLSKIVKKITGMTPDEIIIEDFKKVLIDVCEENLEGVSEIEKIDMLRTIRMLANVYPNEFDEVIDKYRKDVIRRLIK